MTPPIPQKDRREIRKFIRYLQLVANEGVPDFHAYGLVYGETVFEDRETQQAKEPK